MNRNAQDPSYDVVIIGGGAAAFFAAATCAEANPERSIVILERRSQVLGKVKISGGGRCNVTHACYDPSVLVESYPRGQRELLGPFHTWAPLETVEWFEGRGIQLKEESDGRMFPVTDDSQSIVDCLTQAVREAGVEVRTQVTVTRFAKGTDVFEIVTDRGSTIYGRRVLVATGGLREGSFESALRAFGHQIEALAPALFSFHLDDARIRGLEGLSVDRVRMDVNDGEFVAEGPLLVTHWGVSGPAVLKLSSWGARWMQGKGYCFEVVMDWSAGLGWDAVVRQLETVRRADSKKRVSRTPQFQIPRRLWERLVQAATISDDLRWAQLSMDGIQGLAREVMQGRFQVVGKSMNKDEFVTCGGVRLSEVHFKTMESKIVAGLYFAGEVLDIDALTGGYNFQSAWTTGFLAGRSMAREA